MQNVREWAYTVCCVCVIGSMLSMIAPGGIGKRLTGMALSLMTLCVLFRPVSSTREFLLNLKNYSFNTNEYVNSELEDEIEKNAKSVYSSYLEENISRVLKGAGISCKTIAVTMDNSEDGCISIGQVEVIIKNEDVDKTEEIKELLHGYIGFEPVISVQ